MSPFDQNYVTVFTVVKGYSTQNMNLVNFYRGRYYLYRLLHVKSLISFLFTSF